jgi:RimJ/RimL family protein N-acetyltransferase
MAALDDVFRRTGVDEILSYTSVDNARSHAVMARLRLRRDMSRDFIVENERIGTWQGMVRVAERTRSGWSGQGRVLQ